MEFFIFDFEGHSNEYQLQHTYQCFINYCYMPILKQFIKTSIRLLFIAYTCGCQYSTTYTYALERPTFS